MVIDIALSLNQVITTVGMVAHVTVIIAANVAALGVMLRDTPGLAREPGAAP